MTKHMLIMVTMLLATGLHAYRGIGLAGPAGTIFRVTTDKPECDFEVAAGSGSGVVERNNSFVKFRNPNEVEVGPQAKCLGACVRTVSGAVHGQAGVEQYGLACDEILFAVGKTKTGAFTSIKAISTSELQSKARAVQLTLD